MREAWNHSEQERNRKSCQDVRAASLDEKCKLIDDLYRVQRSMHAKYFRCFFPAATDQEVVDHWVRLTCDPELYVAVRLRRSADGYDTLPLPIPRDIRLDAFIRRALNMERRQVFCEHYYESLPEISPV